MRGPCVRWAASSERRSNSLHDRALLLMEATALRHPSTPLARDENEERRGGKRRRWVQIDRKYARVITCFQKCLSAACDIIRRQGSIPRSCQRLWRFYMSFKLQILTIAWFSAMQNKRAQKRGVDPAHVSLGSLCQGNFMIEILYRTYSEFGKPCPA